MQMNSNLWTYQDLSHPVIKDVTLLVIILPAKKLFDNYSSLQS